MSAQSEPAADQRAERAVIGTVLLLNEPRYALSLERRGLRPEDFYWPQMAEAWQAILSLAHAGRPIDPITLQGEMERLGLEAWSEGALEDTIADAPASGHHAEYAMRVIELSRWRDRMRALYGLRDALVKRDAKAWAEVWQATVALLEPPPEEPKATIEAGHLRLVVDDQGQVIESRFEEQEPCGNCQHLEDEMAGLQRDIRGWSRRYAELKRDKDAEAQASILWEPAKALFKIWQRKTKHTRSAWTTDRFFEIEPFLKNARYGTEICERAIAGIAYDPYTRPMKNGGTKRYDDWATCFGSTKNIEEYANRAPRDWKPELAQEYVEAARIPDKKSKPQLKIAEPPVAAAG